MNILHVSDSDLPARHFNGYDLIRDLAARGVNGTQAVLKKMSDNPKVISLSSGRGDDELQDRIRVLERRHSINNLIVPWGRVLAETDEFKLADLVHYHIVHNQVISIPDLKWLIARKPSVWTFHDPWPLTGHCIHPMGCEGWLTGCSPCPFLNRTFPIALDRADVLWRTKLALFAAADVDVVVASPWMLDMVRRSPVTSHLENVHLIPFGVDATNFLGDDQRAESRRRLKVPLGDFVVLIRASSWDAKGLAYVIEALRLRRPDRPTTVIVLDRRGMVRTLRRDYRVIEMGWIDDGALYGRVMSAADVFVMPSLAESFGLMAVEAMAAGRPVVCFEGTAVPVVTNAPDCGVAVALGDAAALRDVLDRLASDPSECARRGALGRELVATRYGHERYLDAMTEMYAAVVARHLPGLPAGYADA